MNYSPNFKFYPNDIITGLPALRLQIQGDQVNYWNAVLKTIGTDLGVVICASNADQKLRLKWNTNSIIESVDTDLVIQTNSLNKHIQLTPHGTGLILLNRPIYFPVGQCIFSNQEVNKHFQLNLSPNIEAPNDSTTSYGSGISFWSSFFSFNVVNQKIFKN